MLNYSFNTYTNTFTGDYREQDDLLYVIDYLLVSSIFALPSVASSVMERKATCPGGLLCQCAPCSHKLITAACELAVFFCGSSAPPHLAATFTSVLCSTMPSTSPLGRQRGILDDFLGA